MINIQGLLVEFKGLNQVLPLGAQKQLLIISNYIRRLH
jgi:hypothetical protein